MKNIEVLLIYALPLRQYLYSLNMSVGSTVSDAISQSGLLEIHTEIDLSYNKIGINGSFAKLSDPLFNGNRIEIYRPLLASDRIFRHRR